MSTLDMKSTIDNDGERARFGNRLRAAREARKLSLRALAKRVDVSASLISQVERGRVMPSVSTLYGIVRELQLSMDELFTEGRPVHDPDHVDRDDYVLRNSDRPTIYLASGVRWERLTAEPDRDLDFQLSTYAVGAESCPPDALMMHGGREFGCVVSGTLHVTIGDQQYDLQPGDSVHFPSRIPHRLANRGEIPTVAIWAVLGRERDSRL